MSLSISLASLSADCSGGGPLVKDEAKKNSVSQNQPESVGGNNGEEGNGGGGNERSGNGGGNNANESNEEGNSGGRNSGNSGSGNGGGGNGGSGNGGNGNNRGRNNGGGNNGGGNNGGGDNGGENNGDSHGSDNNHRVSENIPKGLEKIKNLSNDDIKLIDQSNPIIKNLFKILNYKNTSKKDFNCISAIFSKIKPKDGNYFYDALDMVFNENIKRIISSCSEKQFEKYVEVLKNGSSEAKEVLNGIKNGDHLYKNLNPDILNESENLQETLEKISNLKNIDFYDAIEKNFSDKKKISMLLGSSDKITSFYKNKKSSASTVAIKSTIENLVGNNKDIVPFVSILDEVSTKMDKIYAIKADIIVSQYFKNGLESSCCDEKAVKSFLNYVEEKCNEGEFNNDLKNMTNVLPLFVENSSLLHNFIDGTKLNRKIIYQIQYLDEEGKKRFNSGMKIFLEAINDKKPVEEKINKSLASFIMSEFGGSKTNQIKKENIKFDWKISINVLQSKKIYYIILI